MFEQKKFGLSEARSAEFLHVLQQMHIQVDSGSSVDAVGGTLQLARRYNLSAYDAAYLELALREGLPLATLDDGLLKAIEKVAAKRLFAA